LLLFVDGTPRAYRLRGSNAHLRFATSTGTSPDAARITPADDPVFQAGTEGLHRTTLVPRMLISMDQYFKVAGMACVVLVPFAILSSVAM
jgi:hypothetical protein